MDNDENSSTDSFIELINMQTSTIIIKDKDKEEHNEDNGILNTIWNMFSFNIENKKSYKNFNYYKNIIELNINLFRLRNTNTSLYIFNKSKLD
jgi:hypothetical protein